RGLALRRGRRGAVVGRRCRRRRGRRAARGRRRGLARRGLVVRLLRNGHANGARGRYGGGGGREKFRRKHVHVSLKGSGKSESITGMNPMDSTIVLARGDFCTAAHVSPVPDMVSRIAS